MIFNTINSIFTKRTHSRDYSASHATNGLVGLLPPEVLDLIISHFVNDTPTLLVCALVHPTWTRISRHHLPPLMVVVGCSSRAKELNALLSSSQETISSSISVVTLIYTYTYIFDYGTGRGAPRPYRKLIKTINSKEHMRTRWRLMLSSYRWSKVPVMSRIRRFVREHIGLP